jgi:hypothetical protein
MIKLTDILFEDNGCCSRPKAPLLVEGVRKTLLSENLQYHIDNKLSLTENTFRYGSKSFMELWNEARDLHNAGILILEGEDKAIVEETDYNKIRISNNLFDLEHLSRDVDFYHSEVIIIVDNVSTIPFIIESIHSLNLHFVVNASNFTTENDELDILVMNESNSEFLIFDESCKYWLLKYGLLPSQVESLCFIY